MGHLPMLSGVLLSALLLVASLSVFALGDSRVVLFERTEIPKGWSLVGRANGDQKINFYVALRQRNVDRLEKVLYDVAHPQSPLYSQHWTLDQVLDLVAPPQEEHDAVVRWLREAASSPQGRGEGQGQSDAIHITSLRDSLRVETSVANVEKIFHTKMHNFIHKTSGRRRVAHLGPLSIPAAVRPFVDMVTALSLFPPTRPPKHSGSVPVSRPENTNGWAIPPHLRQLYNIPAGLRGSNPNNWQAAVEFEWPGCFSYTDMEQFAQLVEMPFTNVSRVIPSNEWVDTGCDGESTMDLQLISNIGSGVKTAYFTNEHWIYEFTQTLFALDNAPKVLSLSWGWMEAQQCDGIVNSLCNQLGVDSQGYVKRTNAELAKLGTMGFSVIVCTQDEGAPSDNNAECQLDNTMQPVWPIYPSSSPWVTAVGATTLVANTIRPSPAPQQLATTGTSFCQQYVCNNGTEEVVAMSPDPDTDFTSGGGFSNYTARPSYQDAAVLGFLNNPNTFKPPKTLFAYGGRAYPDISAVGSHVLIVMGGIPQWNGGTSASTPITAGVIGLLNDRRMNQGKKPLGFLNYILYDMGAKLPAAYHDVTVGNNTCTGWAQSVGIHCCEYGYGAAPGWDPATGWGTPDFLQMVKYIDRLP